MQAVSRMRRAAAMPVMDAGEQKWITVNGARIPIGEDGNPQNAAGKKIFGETKPRGCARGKLPVAELKGNELGVKEGETVRDADKRYYEKELMEHPAEREGFGKVSFYKGSGWSKLEHTTKSDEEHLKLLPAVKPVIEKGEYLGAVKPDSSEGKKKRIAAYHYFEANVGLGGKNKYVGVTVIEDEQGNKFYNLVKNPEDVYGRKQAKKAAQVAPDLENGDMSRLGKATDGSEAILNITIAQDAADFNEIFTMLTALRRMCGIKARQAPRLPPATPRQAPLAPHSP
jgi:hypothetical protein